MILHGNNSRPRGGLRNRVYSDEQIIELCRLVLDEGMSGTAAGRQVGMKPAQAQFHIRRERAARAAATFTDIIGEDQR